jgi:hypothetical protein
VEDAGHEAHAHSSPAPGGEPNYRQVGRQALTPDVGLQKTPRLSSTTSGRRAASDIEGEPYILDLADKMGTMVTVIPYMGTLTIHLRLKVFLR